MNDTFVYCVPLPSRVSEMVTPCLDGSYTIYLNENLSYKKKKEAYEHAIRHIKRGDFDYDTIKDVNEIEIDTHSV